MPHVTMPAQAFPGTPGLMQYRLETGTPLSELAEVLLRDANSLTRSERELMAAYASSLNDCYFCTSTHGQMSVQQSADPDARAVLEKVLADLDSAPVSPRIKALLRIAGAVQESGRAVTADMVAVAREHGATDTEIHDTVLIGAAFAMYNRYCDGLAAVVPEDPASYVPMAAMIIRDGYSMCARGH
ncbi:carboxymuconolactone decarboxylase [Saccharothrix sp. NRRL B-16348]|uniref:carboxymuconolactone decarboxylase family protein n=1 Tax=Saccharothrix sp. NRRL B-16348 TaxID=1415542 RepID=UPI0006ADB794|nr:carboxymuconolactone decarboxylase family protein [Saccharothrix sp. NRRL B-16348]KOX34863.1 carboxymuconolactone decarboxylase [Saccharothrix sp. NRRL B-16348]